MWINSRYLYIYKLLTYNDIFIIILGGISAAVTTPLDVVKTRIMLADRKNLKAGTLTFKKMFQRILKKEGIKGYALLL